jgi:transposase-like protein
MKAQFRHMNESKFQEIYQKFKSSKTTKQDFCNIYGYTKSTFYYWLKKWGDGTDIRKPKTIPKLSPIVVLEEKTRQQLPQHIKSLVSSPPDTFPDPGITKHEFQPKSSMEIEISHPTGLVIKMRGNIDLDVFKTLLNQF